MKSNVKVADFVNVPFNSPTLTFFINSNFHLIDLKILQHETDVVKYRFKFFKAKMAIYQCWNNDSNFATLQQIWRFSNVSTLTFFYQIQFWVNWNEICKNDSKYCWKSAQFFSDWIIEDLIVKCCVEVGKLTNIWMWKCQLWHFLLNPISGQLKWNLHKWFKMLPKISSIFFRLNY